MFVSPPPGECLWKKSGRIVELPLISPSNQWTVDLPLALSGSVVGFLLSKLLPLLVLPLGLALLLLLLGLIRRRRGPVLLAVVVLWLFSTGLVAQMLWRLVEWPWQRRAADHAPQADAIVVLSGGRHAAPGPARASEWHDPDRFLAGVELFRAGRAPLLLFTGGQSPFQAGLAPEGELYRREAIGLGVPADAIASTPPVRNTAEEAAAIRALLPQAPSRVLLVTSAFHMRRAQRLFERQGMTVRPFPVDFQARAAWGGAIALDPLMWLPTSRGLDQSSRALRELLGRVIYRSW